MLLNKKLSKVNAQILSNDNKQRKLYHFVAYGSGAIANGISVSTIGFYIFYFIVTIVGLKETDYSIIQVVAQISNAISDPFIGIISDRISTRFGRRRPFILLAAFTMPISFILIFTKMPIKTRTLKFVYYLFAFVLFYMFQTIFNVPHIALLMEISDEEQERNKFVAFSTIFFSIGTLVGPITMETFQLTVFSTNHVKAFMFVSILLSVPMLLGILSVFLFLRERIIDITPKSLKKILLESVVILRNRSYLLLTLINICSSITIQLIQFNTKLYLTHVVGREDLMLYLLITSISSSIILVFPIIILIRKFGKRLTFIGANLFFTMPFILLTFWIPTGTTGSVVLLFCAVFFGLGTAAGFYLPVSMINDVIVEDYIKTGLNREGAITSVYVFFQKVSIGFAHALVALMIWKSGSIDPSATIQKRAVKKALQYSVSVIPLVFITTSFVWLYMYPLVINDEVHISAFFEKALICLVIRRYCVFISIDFQHIRNKSQY